MRRAVGDATPGHHRAALDEYVEAGGLEDGWEALFRAWTERGSG